MEIKTMQELANSLKEVAEEGFGLNPLETLKVANEKWAKYVVNHNIGDALKYGLEISRAIAEYLNALED